ncbi:MAG: Nudix family hydrolase [Sphingobacteriia bacterium]|nr:Nudix family hydrolase [Sphingobacteriia bacterium]NCC39547.1 Nudix family hydrolase [Gammaproteobacteria bacterium]
MVGALQDAAGQVLTTRRADHLHQGGLWEFPGGKLEPGECPEDGLVRELSEELGITVRSSQPLIRIRHDYGDRRVLLDVRRVQAYEGRPRGLEGQPLAWQHPEAMDPARFPAADRPIILALRLAPIMLITGPDPRQDAVFLARLDRAIASGARLVQLRAHELDHSAYARLARRAFELCTQGGAKLLLNRAPEQCRDLPRHGLHLSSTALAGFTERPGQAGELVGASCHDASELRRAQALGLDYALLSPVQWTASHPDARPLGWSGFAELVETASLPVYALGGLRPADLDLAIENGAQGIASIRGLWPLF